MGCHFLLQGISPIQGSNLNLLHWQVNSLSLQYLGSPKSPYDSAVLLLGIADPLVGGFCVCKSTYWLRLICNPHISTCSRVGVIDTDMQKKKKKKLSCQASLFSAEVKQCEALVSCSHSPTEVTKDGDSGRWCQVEQETSSLRPGG